MVSSFKCDLGQSVLQRTAPVNSFAAGILSYESGLFQKSMQRIAHSKPLNWSAYPDLRVGARDGVLLNELVF